MYSVRLLLGLEHYKKLFCIYSAYSGFNSSVVEYTLFKKLSRDANVSIWLTAFVLSKELNTTEWGGGTTWLDATQITYL